MPFTGIKIIVRGKRLLTTCETFGCDSHSHYIGRWSYLPLLSFTSHNYYFM